MADILIDQGSIQTPRGFVSPYGDKGIGISKVAALSWLTQRSGRRTRLALAAAGPVPVTLIAWSAFGADLRVTASLVLVPVVGALLLMVDRRPLAVTLVVRGIAAGVLATALYDASRFGFLWLGLIEGDPIPHIGTALGLEPAWVFGYLWRYLGNGTGLAIAFLALGLHGVRIGMAYGLSVCAGLLLVLAVSPYGEAILFPLSWTTIVMATIGHLVYGAGLGAVAARWHRAATG